MIALTGNININNIIVGNGAAARMANTTSNLNATITDDKDFSVFPNPVKDVLNVTLKDNSKATISLYNASGVKVLEQTSNQKRVMLNVSKLRPGLYTLKTTTLNGIIEKRVIIE